MRFMAIVYSKWAVPLLTTINADIAKTSAQASSLLTPIVYAADLFEDEAKFLTGNFGFDGYMGVPGLMGADGKQVAAEFNVAWQTVEPALNPSLRALTSASGVVVSNTYATSLRLADTMPLVFSVPVLPSTLDGDGSDFEVTLNNGTTVARRQQACCRTSNTTNDRPLCSWVISAIASLLTLQEPATRPRWRSSTTARRCRCS